MSFGIVFPPVVLPVTPLNVYRIAEGVTLAGGFASVLIPATLEYTQGSSFITNASTGKYVFTRAGTYRIDMNTGGTLCESSGSAIWAELYDSTDTLVESSTATTGQGCSGSASFMTFTGEVNGYLLVYYRGDPALTTSSANSSRYQFIITKLS
jgi:hypothetical protein